MKTSYTGTKVSTVKLMYHGIGMCYKAGKKCPLIVALTERKLIKVYETK